MKYTLKWKVDEIGFKFFILEREQIIPVKKWEEISQYLPKYAFFEISLLNRLIDEGKANLSNNYFLLPHEQAAHLSEEEREDLDLPGPFPFIIELRAKGNLTDKNLEYIYCFLNGRDEPFINPKKIGAYLEITKEQTYLLTGELYHLITAIDEFNQKPSDEKSIKNNLIYFAKIKGLAKETGAILDSYLSSEQVIYPSKITLRVKQIEKDVIEIEPVFCEQKDKENNTVLKPLLNESQKNSFLKIFDRFRQERDMYAIPGGPKIVLNEKQKNELGKIKKNRHVFGKKKELLLRNPSNFFDPNIIDFDTPLIEGEKLVSWSDRVLEIGEYRPRYFPFIQPSKEPWLPPESGIILGDNKIYIPSNEAPKLKQKLEEAIKRGKKEIVWKEHSIPVNQATINTLEKLIEICPSSEVTSKQAIENAKEIKKKKYVLIIKDNFEKIEHKYEAQVRPGKFSYPLSLKSGTTLLPHQQEGLSWLQTLWINGAKGALLADDMGLGKTLQTLSFMAWVQEIMDKGQLSQKPMLVVAPVSLLENWQEEYKRFFEPIWGHFIELHGNNLKEFKNKNIAKNLGIRKEIGIQEDIKNIINSFRDGLLLKIDKIPSKSVVITTYETLRDYQFSFGLIDWCVMIIDEAQKIKTPNTLVTNAIKAMKYEFGVALTGTPVENSWVDLWSIMDFVQPAHLGSLKEFVATYQNPLKNPDTDRERLGLNLQQKIGNLLKRRIKNDHLKGLPPKYIYPYHVEMSEKQLNTYLSIIQNVRNNINNSSSIQTKQHIFTILGALRDISIHPYLPFFSQRGLNEFSDDDIIKVSAKFIKTIEILDTIYQKGEKVVIFLINKKLQPILARIIKNRYHIHVHIVNGDTLPSRRKQFINAFQENKGFNAIIMSPEAAGIGLNVTAANHVIHISRPWNPAKEDQATDRVYRIGQKRPVFIHIPLAVHPLFDNELYKGSFDIKLHRLLENKRQLSQSVLLPSLIEEQDWMSLGNEILNISSSKEEKISLLTLTEIDHLTPEMFEKIIAVLYKKMGYIVEITPPNRDYGADIVALKRGESKKSLLIQCKHTIDPDRSQNQKGVQEIIAACSIYENYYNEKFKPLVITNANKFTDQAVELAKANDVDLIAREKLTNLIDYFKLTLSV